MSVRRSDADPWLDSEMIAELETYVAEMDGDEPDDFPGCKCDDCFIRALARREAGILLSVEERIRLRRCWNEMLPGENVTFPPLELFA